MQKRSFFIIEKIKIKRKCPAHKRASARLLALTGWPGACNWQTPISVLRKGSIMDFTVETFLDLKQGQLLNKLSKISRPTNFKQGQICRAGHFQYFLTFSIIKTDFFSPSKLSLLKNAKNHFFKLKNLKNTESAQLCKLVFLGGLEKAKPGNSARGRTIRHTLCTEPLRSSVRHSLRLLYVIRSINTSACSTAGSSRTATPTSSSTWPSRGSATRGAPPARTLSSSTWRRPTGKPKVRRRAGHLRCFWIFSIIKMMLCIPS